jgi:hypothetical protein
MEMRDVLLDTEEKEIFVIKWQITWFTCNHVLVFCVKQHKKSGF